MKNNQEPDRGLFDALPLEIQIRSKLSIAIAGRIEALMKEKGLSKKKFAEAMGRRPSEITKWLSGEHNFTVGTLSMLSAFFNDSIIEVVSND